MRTPTILALPLLALLGPGAPATADIDPGPCREQWTELVSLHAENDNPGGAVPELVARWEATYDTGRQYAETATDADCGETIAAYARTWGQLESFMYDLLRYDERGRLAGAEGDRRHALDLNDLHHLSPRLEQQFRIARRQAPAAAADLAPALAPAATVDVSDRAATHAVRRTVRDTARASHHVHVLNRALRIIGDAELDEE